MDSELNNTVQNNETSEQKNESVTVDFKELQSRIKALESENGKLKQSVTNASADASKWKKQYQEKLSAEEQAQVKQEEANAALQKKIEDLLKERNIAKISGALVANDIGMDAETANAVAEAMNAGETDKVLDGIRQFIIAHDKSLKENAILNNQTLQSGKIAPVYSKEDIDKMGYKELVQLKNEYPELYNEYMKK